METSIWWYYVFFFNEVQERSWIFIGIELSICQPKYGELTQPVDGDLLGKQSWDWASKYGDLMGYNVDLLGDNENTLREIAYNSYGYLRLQATGSLKPEVVSETMGDSPKCRLPPSNK